MSLTLTKSQSTGPPIARFVDDKKQKIYVEETGAVMLRPDGGVVEPDHSQHKRVMVFPDQELQFIPYKAKNQRNAIYVVGASGSGKSTFIANAIKTQPKKDTFLFTTASDLDPALEKIKGLTKINYMGNKDKLLEVRVEDLEDSICIFDDHDNSTDRDVNLFMQRLVNSILENGRKLKIDLYVVSHNPRDFMRTRTLILECDTYVLFPQTNRVATKNFMKEYYDDDKVFLNKIKNLNDGGRFTFAAFHKNVPRYMVTKHSVQLLD